jgi:hypothetical protein
MSETKFDETAAATQSTQPAELDERELSQVAGGLVPAVAPASAKCPIVIVD